MKRTKPTKNPDLCYSMRARKIATGEEVVWAVKGEPDLVALEAPVAAATLYDVSVKEAYE